MRQIPLTLGYVALVDDEDYDRVMAAGKWHARPDRKSTYARRTIGTNGRRRNVYLHSVLTGWPLVDHANGNGLDNRRANLRPATNAENQRNRPVQANNTSGFKGVGLHRGKWRAQIKLDGKRRHLGYFATPDEAGRAYDDAARELHGEFARLNFPGPSERGVGH